MRTARNNVLNGREFGADVLAAPGLDRWLSKHDLPLLAVLMPDQTPAFVQVEYFFCAFEAARFADLGPTDAQALMQASADLSERADALSIERAARRIQADGRRREALPLVQSLSLDPAVTASGLGLDAIAPWLFGAVGHRTLRDLLRAAVADGELLLLDGATLKPKAQAPVPAARLLLAQEPAPDRGRRVKPPQAFPAQEDEILRVIRELGHEPNKLPPRLSGKPWAKSEVWKAIGVSQLFVSAGVFNKAWERLRASKAIAERPGL